MGHSQHDGLYRTLLAEVMEHAVKFFRMSLQQGIAADARAYLDRRGLNAQALERWEIGFAPDSWQGLWDHLIAKGVEPDLILGAGGAVVVERAPFVEQFGFAHK